MKLSSFLEAISAAPASLLILLPALGVLFVNGWTDAPNAIASAIGSGALSKRRAILLAAVMNVLGGLFALMLAARVAETVYYIGSFSPAHKLPALSAALLAVIGWAIFAWRFGIPTSESHGLMAGLMGAALASGGSLSGVALGRIGLGLLLSMLPGYFGGWLLSEWLAQLRLPARRWRQGQCLAAGLMAFAHGLQDTPKFASILLLAASAETAAFRLPFWAALFCSLLMGLGTLLGGGRIIDTVGSELVKIDPQQGFAADLAGGLILLFNSLQGLPVSSTHAKTCALMGAAAAGGRERLNRRIAASMLLAWLLTFPACGLAAFLLTKLFLFF